uniref:MICOS complex subunit MIC60 n=1 Tax=Rhabditophanes sp. KR3021 TaxID=114890 RepID=A0AC35TT46_9BILA
MANLGTMKKLFIAAGVAGSAVGGTVVAGTQDKAFRQKVECTIPQSKLLFNALAGDSKSIVENKPTLPHPPLIQAKKVSKEIVPQPKQAVLQDEDVVVQKAVEVTPIEVNPVKTVSKVDAGELYELENCKLQKKLIDALDNAQQKVQQATSSTFFTIQKMKNHTNALKAAIDNGVNADWDTVTFAMKEVKDHQKLDKSYESDALNCIASLEQIIDQGKANPETASNPLILNCLETVNKMKSEMNRAKILVNTEKNEIYVLDNYKNLIEKSRQAFWDEVHAVAPSADLSASGNTLTEKELNSLLVHAHLKNETLRNRLIEQQLREQKNVVAALEEQKIADRVMLKKELDMKIAEIERSNSLGQQAQIAKLRSDFEKGLATRLEREKLVHSDHLEKVIRTQKQIYDIEHSEKVYEAIMAERSKHGEEFELAISQLEGIEHALDKRAVLDIQNRKAKQSWISCQNLLESIQFGIKSGESLDARRKPLQKEIDVIKNSGKGDIFMETVLKTFTQEALEKGVYTSQDLKNRFNQIYDVSRKVAKIDENGGSIFKYLSSYVQSFFMFDLGREYSSKEKIDLNNPNTFDILERARYFVNKGDFETAIKITQLLSGEPRAIASSWIKDTQTFLETHLLAQLLAARSVVISACSVY